MHSLDFAAIKRSVELAPLLRRYQVKLRRSGAAHQWRGCCPIHGGDGRDAFHANFRKNVFHCFSCGAGGTVLDFVAAIERCSLYEAAWKLTQPTGGHSLPAASCGSQLVTKKMKSVSPLGFTLRGIDGTHPYLAGRGIESAVAREFGIGYYAGPGILSGRVVIPIHNERGGLVAYSGRAIDGAEPRYRFPAGFAKSQVLFNFHRAAATTKTVVVVVEGFFDCLRLHQAGVRSVVALMGSALYQPQQQMLRQRFQRVILMLDGDPAGRLGSAHIAAQLRPYAAVRVVHLPDGVQPDQLPPEAAREILQASREPSRIV